MNFFRALLPLVCLLVSLSAYAQPAPAPLTGDFAIGAADARIVIVAYVSPTCPACRRWHDTVLPDLEARFIATKQARLVFKETPSHNKELDAAIFGLARCAGPQGYRRIMDRTFAAQEEIAKAARSPGGARPALGALARVGGVEPRDLEACIGSSDLSARLAAVRDERIALGVSGTPTFFIDGARVATADAMNPQRFLELVEAALSRER